MASAYHALALTSLKAAPLLVAARPRERVISAANSARVTFWAGENAVSLVPVMISLEAKRSMADLAQ
ncbi:hypothetical protein D3C79_1064990 [compost metagenome]